MRTEERREEDQSGWFSIVSKDRPPHPMARTVSTRVTLPMGEDDPHRGHLSHGRGRPAPRSPRPLARTTRAEVTSPMGEDDPRRRHLAHGRGRPAPRSPHPWARTTRIEVTSPMGEDRPPVPKPFILVQVPVTQSSGPLTQYPCLISLSKKDFGKSYKNLVVETGSCLPYKTATEKINVKFPKIIMKGDEKWKTHLATNLAQEKSGMTIDADKDKQTHDGTSVNANADRTPAGNVSTVTTNAVILDKMKEMFASA
ncbi:hypothetical protein F2Q69_00015723 [Brassica cretica]|uniref:Uncharacterized protein n=1 Tax=Brassica cretica TaxID=69181 RepID=A0A8S9QQX0_BRACR|nr:hypothetical protein F2Q69_00015723 [Brassica cretica]